MYCTTYPCKDCSIDIVQSGIKEVTYLGTYKSEIGERVLREAGVDVKQYQHGVNPKSFAKFWG